MARYIYHVSSQQKETRQLIKRCLLKNYYSHYNYLSEHSRHISSTRDQSCCSRWIKESTYCTLGNKAHATNTWQASSYPNGLGFYILAILMPKRPVNVLAPHFSRRHQEIRNKDIPLNFMNLQQVLEWLKVPRGKHRLLTTSVQSMSLWTSVITLNTVLDN